MFFFDVSGIRAHYFHRFETFMYFDEFFLGNKRFYEHEESDEFVRLPCKITYNIYNYIEHKSIIRSLMFLMYISEFGRMANYRELHDIVTLIEEKSVLKRKGHILFCDP